MANLTLWKRPVVKYLQVSRSFDSPVCFPFLTVSSYFVTFTHKKQKEEEKLFDKAGKFRKLEILKKPQEKRKRRKYELEQLQPPRHTRMPIDQDWTNVWPTARTFNPSVVPFPIHQGFTEKTAPPGKFANPELMKIPNFLHLTPPAIKKHCEAIKKFCTPWPKELHTDELCERHFPIEVVTNDYCHSGPSIKDPKARIVTLKVRLETLNLDYHAKDKLLRLVGDKYNRKTNMLTLTVDRCPLKMQNYDYAYYLLTALYHESLKLEPWESEKTFEDMEKYVWSQNKSCQTVTELIKKLKEIDSKEQMLSNSSFAWLKAIPEDILPETLCSVEPITSYAKCVTDMHNEGENEEILNKYKTSVKNLLGLSSNANEPEV